jgi:uncharacterized membrane protein YebE (DUF533 family)
MKKGLLVVTALSVFSFTNFSVYAQSGPGSYPQAGKGGEGGPRPEFKQKMLQRFDTNRDGMLDESERAQMKEAMHKRAMQEQGGARGFSPSETPQGGGSEKGGGFGMREFDNPQREQFKQRMMQRFDGNHDGQLNDAERSQMHEAIQRRRAQEGGFGGGFPAGGGFPGGPSGQRQ